MNYFPKFWISVCDLYRGQEVERVLGDEGGRGGGSQGGEIRSKKSVDKVSWRMMNG